MAKEMKRPLIHLISESIEIIQSYRCNILEINPIIFCEVLYSNIISTALPFIFKCHIAQSFKSEFRA